MLRNRFGYSEEDAFEVVELSCELHLDNENLAKVILALDIDTIELVVFVLLIALTFKYFLNRCLVSKKHCN